MSSEDIWDYTGTGTVFFVPNSEAASEACDEPEPPAPPQADEASYSYSELHYHSELWVG